MLSIIEQYREYCSFCWRIVLCRSTQGNTYGNASDRLHFFQLSSLCICTDQHIELATFKISTNFTGVVVADMHVEHYFILICVVEVGALKGSEGQQDQLVLVQQRQRQLEQVTCRGSWLNRGYGINHFKSIRGKGGWDSRRKWFVCVIIGIF